MNEFMAVSSAIVAVAIILLMTLTVIIPIATQASSSSENPPPPPSGYSGETNGTIPPPTLPLQSSENLLGNTPPNPPPPPTPSTSDLKRDALRELNHAYDEFNTLNNLISYARENGVVVNNIDDLKTLALGLYKNGLEYFKSGNYVKARIYAHLAIESVHGIRDLINYELAVNNIVPPPPQPPSQP